MSLKVSKEVWEALGAQLKGMRGAHVKVGVLASKGGNARVEGADITKIELAAIHEFGSPAANIPERSFIRATLEIYRAELVAFQSKLAKAIVLQRITPAQALKMLGEWAVAKIRARITEGDGIPPPLKPRTIARKGSSRPLVDTTRNLLGAISYEVVGGDAPAPTEGS